MAPRKPNTTASEEEYNLEEEALIRQWLEYRKVVLDRLENPQSVPISICQDLNNHLMNKTYLAGNKYSKADFEVLKGLLDFYVLQSMQVKERYNHLSRWFSHVQHLNQAHLTPKVAFSKTLLY